MQMIKTSIALTLLVLPCLANATGKYRTFAQCVESNGGPHMNSDQVKGLSLCKKQARQTKEQFQSCLSMHGVVMPNEKLIKQCRTELSSNSK